MDTLTTQQILDAGLDDWRKLAQAIHARFAIADFRTGAAFIGAVAEAADAANHHPDIRFGYGYVDLALTTHDNGYWVTAADLELARQISTLAATHGLTPRPSEVTQLELALDTARESVVGPFWSALLTGSAGNKIHDSVFDPTGRVPSLWFQETSEHEPPRQRWHFDLWLAPEVVSDRIAAAVAAGGRVVDDGGAPSFTVLADPDDNRVCICTYLDRA